jgi:predicted lipid-binding transport protein (Tim44 family)
MNDRLLMASVAAVGFLAGLAMTGGRAGLWHPSMHARVQASTVAPQAMPVLPVMPAPAAHAATEPQPAAEPPASDRPGDGDGAPLAAPTDEAHAAAQERAAAHSARSR